MEFQHELVIPDEGLPFKFFLFEGKSGELCERKTLAYIHRNLCRDGRLSYILFK